MIRGCWHGLEKQALHSVATALTRCSHGRDTCGRVMNTISSNSMFKRLQLKMDESSRAKWKDSKFGVIAGPFKTMTDAWDRLAAFKKKWEEGALFDDTHCKCACLCGGKACGHVHACAEQRQVLIPHGVERHCACGAWSCG